MPHADDVPVLPSFVLAEQTHLRFPSRPHWIEAMVEFLRQKAILAGACQESRAGKLMIALHEALSNAIIHGNLELPSGLKEQGDDAFARALAERVATEKLAQRNIHVTIDCAEDRCRWIITDEGPGFDVDAVMGRLQSDEPDVLLASGRGILIMKSFLDEVRYENGGRRLILALRREAGEEKRQTPRRSLHHPVRIAPIRADGSVDWQAAYEAISRDFSSSGVGLLQQHLVENERVLIGFTAQNRMVYVAAEVRHCRSMGGVVELGCRFHPQEPPEVPPTGDVQEAIETFLAERLASAAPADERRAFPRVSYTEQIEILLDDGERRLGFARDLSKGGLAFIVHAPLPAEVVLVLPTADGARIRLRARIVRCNKIMEGFFDIGAHFMQLA